MALAAIMAQASTSAVDSRQQASSPSSPSRSIDNDASSAADTRAVRAHYAGVDEDASRAARRASPVYALRCVNNWVKRVAIDEHARGARRVLDLCGGRGGDLDKWWRAGARDYVLVDVAEEQVARAAARWRRHERDATMRARFVCADAFGPFEALRTAIVGERGAAVAPFDVVACHFALHYACGDAGRLANALANVRALLRDGGVLLCTTIDAARIVGLCWPPPVPDAGPAPPLPARGGDGRYHGRVLRVDFDERDWRRLAPFGARYRITVGERVRDCAEYLVHAPTLVAMAQRGGALELERAVRFDELCAHVLTADPYGVHAQRWRTLVPQRRCDDDASRLTPDMDDEQWRAVSLYCLLVFRKRERTAV